MHPVRLSRDCSWDCVVWDLDGTLTVPGLARAAPGVRGVLAAWAERGTPMAVATSAPTPAARRLVDELGWTGLLGHVAGTGPGVGDKEAVVVEALLGLGRALPDGAAGAVLIGDSPGDMRAARAHDLDAVGVAWGAAEAAALLAAGASWVAAGPDELRPS